MPDASPSGLVNRIFSTPWHIREATIFALEKGRTSYTDNRGHAELRKAISHHVEHVYKAECYDPEDEILVTVGVSEAIDLAVTIPPGGKSPVPPALLCFLPPKDYPGLWRCHSCGYLLRR